MATDTRSPPRPPQPRNQLTHTPRHPCRGSQNAAQHADLPGDLGETDLKRPSPLRPRPTGSAFATTVALLEPREGVNSQPALRGQFSTGLDKQRYRA